jgi:pyridoxamine 5'-phosphate oxidase
MDTIAAIRKEYRLKTLLEKEVDPDALAQFKIWWQEALDSNIEEANAMTLATASADGLPAARIVLLKGVAPEGFSFFTNYNSYKAQQLAENPRACLVFFWRELERQVRITGLVEKLPASESDAYYLTRPEASRIGAWASPQSQIIESRDWLLDRENRLKQQYRDQPVPRPAHWGGYRVKPVTIEFWQGRPGRLHDRLQYSLQENGKWNIERLAP